jgi:hypothetical protein
MGQASLRVVMTRPGRLGEVVRRTALPVGLGFGVGVVVLGLQGWPELDAGLEERAGLTDRLERAVQLGWSGAVAVAEQAVVLTAQPGHLGSDRIGGQRRGLAVEGFDLVGDGQVFVGDGAVGDLGVAQRHVDPTLSTGWLDYAQHAGFATDTARVRKPRDKPKVERAVQYVRGNFFAEETFIDLADAQRRVVTWCSRTAGMRAHGTTAARPAEVFAQDEQRCLLTVPAGYDVPMFTRVKVHRDFHVEVARALYSVPEAWLGQYLDARADSELIKLFHRGQLVKTPPPPGARRASQRGRRPP